MSRKFIALLLSGSLAFGTVSTGAWSAPVGWNSGRSEAVQTVAAARNQSPLPPGNAAGIQEAQGASEISPLLAGAIVAGILLIGYLVLIDDDDDDGDGTPPTTGT